MQMPITRKRISLPAVAAYLGAFLFALHLPTYLIPTIRDATPASAPLVLLPLWLFMAKRRLNRQTLLESVPTLPTESSGQAVLQLR